MSSSAKPIVAPKAPNLTNAPQNYDAGQQTQVNSQLRTYFQRVDTNTQQSTTTLNSTTTLLWLGGL